MRQVPCIGYVLDHYARWCEAGDSIHVPHGQRIVHESPCKPDCFLDSEISAEIVLIIRLAEMRVAVRVHKAGFRHQHRPFAISVYGTSFENEWCVHARHVRYRGDARCQAGVGSVFVSWDAKLNAVVVEAPVNSDDLAAMHDKCRAGIACPRSEHWQRAHVHSRSA